MAMYSAVRGWSPNREGGESSSRSPPRSGWDDASKEQPLGPAPRRPTLRERVSKKAGKMLVSWWAWELVAAISSFLATGALIGLLIMADGKLQQTYPFGSVGITLNTIVAILATIGRASTVVVVAGPLGQGAWNWFAYGSSGNPSRPARPLGDMDTFGDAVFSSWSSLKLIWLTKGRSLAALGALLTVLSFFYDAFVQQVLNTELRTIRTDDFGAVHSLPRAGSYLQVNASDTSLDMSWFAGVTNPTAPFPDSWCPTGNCTWPTTPSLGVCGKCKDVSQGIYRVNSAIVDQNEVTGANQSATIFEYFLPTDSWQKDLGYFDNRNGTRSQYPAQRIGFSSMPPSQRELNASISGVFDPHELPASLDYLPLELVEFIGITQPSIDQLIAAYGPNYDQNITHDFLDPLVRGYSCMYYLCLHAYNGSTSLGNTTQSEVGTWSKIEMIDNGTWQFVDVPKEMNVEDVGDYQVSNDTWRNFRVSIGLYYQNNVTQEVAPDTLPETQGLGGGPPFTMMAMWNASETLASMDNFVNQISTGVTSHMRAYMPGTAPSSNATLYSPQIWRDATFVAVYWGWLAFPLFIFVAGIIFLVATMIETRRLRARPWKSHRLPLLMARLDSSLVPAAGPGLDEWHGVRNRVGDVPVRIAYDWPDRLVVERGL